MVHWLLTRIMAGEYALNRCSAAEKLMEGVFGSVCLIEEGERERRSQRYGWGCCDSCELSQCLCVSQQPPEGDWRHSPHRLADKNWSPQLNELI